MKKTTIILSTDSFDEAVRVLRRGGIVAYPTETFYGLAVDPFNEEAVENLFLLKGRDFKEPVSVIIGGAEMLKSLVDRVSVEARRLADKFWPGPLTIVLPAKDTVPKLLTGKGERGATIGVRVPGCEAARRLSMEFGGPITATSANPSGLKSPVKLSEVTGYFEGKIEIIIDGDEDPDALSGTAGSTLVELTDGRMKIIRAGEITLESLKA
jgi:L-threonylcarbamoyladenylate synthase